MIEIKLEGLDEVSRAIELMPDDMARRCVEPAMRAGATTIRNAITGRARQTFKAHTGKLFKGIAVQIKRKKNARGFVLRYKIGIKTQPADAHAFYGRFWERGFRHIGRGKARMNALRRGTIGGKPMRREFIGPAFEAIYPTAFQQVIAIARERVHEVLEEFERRARLKSRGNV